MSERERTVFDPRPAEGPAPKPRWFDRAEPGRMRAAVDRALAGLVLAGPALISAEMARDLADLVDSARERQDPKLWLASAGRLDGLMANLGAAPAAPAGPDAIGDALGSGPE